MQRPIDKQTRALTILHALETSLDFKRGGEIAVSLATIYRESRKRILEATAVGNPGLHGNGARLHQRNRRTPGARSAQQVDRTGELAPRY